MVVEIVTQFNPLRMQLRRQEPLQMKVTLINKGDHVKKLSLYVALPNALSFGKGGYKTREVIRIDRLLVGESKLFYFDIYPKPNTREGDYLVEVRAQEQTPNNEFVGDEHIHNAEIVIVWGDIYASTKTIN